MRCIAGAIQGMGSSPVRITAAVIIALVVGRGAKDGAIVAQSGGACATPANAIVAENCLPGQTGWDLARGNDPGIQGFATDISVNAGETVTFKIRTDATSYRIDIYRLGYYNGVGARRIVTQSMTAAQPQPDCLTDLSTGLVDCGNWAPSAAWDTTGAVSGIYLAKLTRTDAGFTGSGTSHIVFVVRNDAGHSDLLFQTSDTTWQAYNRYGGNSLYFGSPAGRAYKVSYNRPFDTRDHDPQSWVFNAEYPMVRWLEANGYDVSYFAGVDADRFGTLIKNHKVFLSVGHDEYWSGSQRTQVEAARDAGVHLAFFSGNEIFWKTRWENSLSSPATSYRTLVSYKETHANAKIDPSPEWTGTWRDPRFSPPADGGRPENALTGTIFTVNCCTDAITVPAAKGSHRFWRNTAIAALPSGAVATLPYGTLGYEWDEDLDNGFRPAGLTRLSSTTVSVPEKLQNHGSAYAPGTATHSLTLYRRNSGLVFGAGTVQWAWGLDSVHDRGNAPPDVRMQQATVNLFADMTVQPGSLQPGLMAATASTDTTVPSSTIVSPAGGTAVNGGGNFTITGSASDVNGTVAGVEVSVDGGATWHPASGTTNWSYQWLVGKTGPTIIYSRATDDSGNIEAVLSGVAVTVGPRVCPCTSLWNHATTVPSIVDSGDAAAVEVGVKFASQNPGYIMGLRFYKSPGNTGTHVANLWSGTGTLLKSATFTSETAQGWQHVRFSAPVLIEANTTYVASYHTNVGRYSVDRNYFSAAGVDASPLSAPPGSNGVFVYGPSAFPTSTFQSTNYWVDVEFAEAIADVPLAISNVSAAAIDGSTAVLRWRTNDDTNSRVEYSLNPALPSAETRSVTDAAFVRQHRVTLTDLTPGATYYFRITSGNHAGSSAIALAPGFTLPGPTFRDTASVDFLSGTIAPVCDSNGANCRPGTYIGESNGEVSLTPTVGAEFSASRLPAEWTGVLWQTGGAFEVADGRLRVDGARVGTCNPTAVPDCEAGTYGPGRSLLYAATFTGDPFQHAGFGVKFEDQTPRAVFTTDSNGALHAQSVGGTGVVVNTPLDSALLGTPHRFRIDWAPSRVDYWVDDVQVASHPVAINGPLRPVAGSDFNTLGGDIVVDWIRMTPYASAGSFLSRVFDAHATVEWHTVTWHEVKPAGTGLTISVRTGDTPTPDPTWTGFVTIPTPGPITGTSRYVQYRAELTTADVSRTPELTDIVVTTARVPVAVADTATTNGHTPYIFRATGPTSLTINDTDPDTPRSQLRVVAVSAPAHGTATLANGAVTYAPATGFAGDDGFTYTVSDGLLTAVGQVSISVN
jgi:hypothetical protein